MSSFVIGIDVGGTNTDVAIVQGNKVVGWNKSSTTQNIIDGVIQSIEKSLESTQENGYPNIRNEITRISIGELFLLGFPLIQKLEVIFNIIVFLMIVCLVYSFLY